MDTLPTYDCHCHILPGLDDGARSMDEALYLAGRLAASTTPPVLQVLATICGNSVADAPRFAGPCHA